jgi:hypothetical protein
MSTHASTHSEPHPPLAPSPTPLQMPGPSNVPHVTVYGVIPTTNPSLWSALRGKLRRRK